LPWQLCQAFQLTKTRLIFFSTHYLNKDPKGERSLYASTKAQMENLLREYHNAQVFRVGSLYGPHFPMKTLPGKIVQRYLSDMPVTRAINLVTPTSTDWLAEQLVACKPWTKEPNQKPFSIGPAGFCSVGQWISEIIKDLSVFTGSITEDPSGFFDDTYPIESHAEIGFGTHWDEVWSGYGPAVVAAAYRALTVKVESK
jgi:dTDP-4-dehydrorhamnose reductase